MEELHRFGEIGIGDWTAVSVMHEVADDFSGASFVIFGASWFGDENFSAAGAVAGALRRERSIDGDLVDGRGNSRVPMHIEMSLVRLAFGFEKFGRIFQESDADGMRSAGDGEAELQVLIDFFVTFAAGRRSDDESLDGSAVDEELDGVRFAEAFDFLVAIAGEADLDFVFGVLGKVMSDERSSAGAEGQTFLVFLLGEIGREPVSFT